MGTMLDHFPKENAEDPACPMEALPLRPRCPAANPR